MHISFYQTRPLVTACIRGLSIYETQKVCKYVGKESTVTGCRAIDFHRTRAILLVTNFLNAVIYARHAMKRFGFIAVLIFGLPHNTKHWTCCHEVALIDFFGFRNRSIFLCLRNWKTVNICQSADLLYEVCLLVRIVNN